MAKSILRIALRLQNTRDALIFGKTLSEEERTELRTLIVLLRYFKQNIEHKPELQMKITWKMQFIREAVEFSEKKIKEPFNKMDYVKGLLQ